MRVTQNLSLKVPAGVDDGSRLKLRGEGEAGIGGGPPGDLYVVISVAEHPLFTRQGKDIICEIPVSFTQLALGAEIEVPTLEDKSKLKIPAGTQTGTVFRLKGKGIPDLQGYGKGDELVRVHVEVPRKLTARQRELLEEYARNGGEDVSSAQQGLPRPRQRDVRVRRAWVGYRSAAPGSTPAHAAPTADRTVRSR